MRDASQLAKKTDYSACCAARRVSRATAVAALFLASVSLTAKPPVACRQAIAIINATASFFMINLIENARHPPCGQIARKVEKPACFRRDGTKMPFGSSLPVVALSFRLETVKCHNGRRDHEACSLKLIGGLTTTCSREPVGRREAVCL